MPSRHRPPSPRVEANPEAGPEGPESDDSVDDRSPEPAKASRPSVRPSRHSRASEPRHIDKARTRRALLDGALELLDERSIDNLGIREVTRAAGVAPAAFYRHFDRIDDLGVVLAGEAFATLRQLMRDARDDVVNADDIISRSITALVRHIHDHRAHYRFIAREGYSPVMSVRLAIRTEIRLFSTELATDLARLPVVDRWPVADLVMLADLIVDLMVNTAQRILEAIDEAPEREPQIIADAEQRLRYLAVGATAWNPSR